MFKTSMNNDNVKSKKENKFFAAGASGGMIAALITSPLEVVKTRLQTKRGRDSFSPQQRSSTFRVLSSIVKSEGPLALWRGITPNLIGVVPARAIYFGSYSKVKSSMFDHGFEGTQFNFLAAAFAGSLSATFTCPIWVVKTRLQLMPIHSPAKVVINHALAANSLGGVISGGFGSSNNTKFFRIRDIAGDMYRREGMGVFFKGLSASYWSVSEGAIQLALYEEMKLLVDDPNKFQLFSMAAAAKLFAAVCTYPLEVVRTRMRDERTPIGSELRKYRNVPQTIGQIYKDEGRIGLYSGMVPHLIKVVPNAAIMYFIVEMVAGNC